MKTPKITDEQLALLREAKAIEDEFTDIVLKRLYEAHRIVNSVLWKKNPSFKNKIDVPELNWRSRDLKDRIRVKYLQEGVVVVARQDDGKEKTIHKVFYTGSDRDIASFTRAAFAKAKKNKEAQEARELVKTLRELSQRQEAFKKETERKGEALQMSIDSARTRLSQLERTRAHKSS